MTLHKEEMLTRSGIGYAPALDADIYRMDERQLEEYLGALLLGYRFDLFESIAFLPTSAWLSENINLGTTFGFLFAYAGNPEMAAKSHNKVELPQPYSSYIDPEFRTRLMSILTGIMGDAVSGRDVLERYKHVPHNPLTATNGKPRPKRELDEYRLKIIQGCLEIASYIFMKDGPNSMSTQNKASILKLHAEHKGPLPVNTFMGRVLEEEQLQIHPDHQQLLILILSLVSSEHAPKGLELDNVIVSYLSLLE